MIFRPERLAMCSMRFCMTPAYARRPTLIGCALLPLVAVIKARLLLDEGANRRGVLAVIARFF